MRVHRLPSTIRPLPAVNDCTKHSLQIFGLAVLVLLLSPTASSQGGPPFRTDDPETPGNRQWEINLGFIGHRAVAEGSFATPNVDLNYGIGDRIQVKFELPLSIQEWRGDSAHVVAGLGNSLIGVKWRFYERRAQITRPGRPPKDEVRFSMSSYPQVELNNPARSVSRGIVDAGPQVLLPVEANANLGPIRIVGEVGYWFTTRSLPASPPNSWIRGLIVGHEFKNRSELYLELHDEADIDDITRESTIGIGGRLPFARHGKILFLGMVGRSLGAATPANGQPDWIAYFGLQFRLGPDPQP